MTMERRTRRFFFCRARRALRVGVGGAIRLFKHIGIAAKPGLVCGGLGGSLGLLQCAKPCHNAYATGVARFFPDNQRPAPIPYESMMTTTLPHLCHFSYHKCLTVYFSQVMNRTFARVGPGGVSRGFVHLNSRKSEFASALEEYRLVSLNNHVVDLDSIGDFRATRFVRDPRDLLVSGYFYHRRAAEPWCGIKNPTSKDWEVVNGSIPRDLPSGLSFAEYLQSASKEDGLLAELDFRRAHFDSMVRWPDNDDRILTLHYDDIMSNEVYAFERIFDHYGIRGLRRRLGLRSAQRYSASGSARRTQHIRNPSSGQWKSVLTPRVLAELERRHPEAIERYGSESFSS